MPPLYRANTDTQGTPLYSSNSRLQPHFSSSGVQSGRVHQLQADRNGIAASPQPFTPSDPPMPISRLRFTPFTTPGNSDTSRTPSPDSSSPRLEDLLVDPPPSFQTALQPSASTDDVQLEVIDDDADPSPDVEQSMHWWERIEWTNIARTVGELALSIIKSPYTLPKALLTRPLHSTIPGLGNPVYWVNGWGHWAVDNTIGKVMGHEQPTHRSLFTKLGQIRRHLDEEMDAVRQRLRPLAPEINRLNAELEEIRRQIRNPQAAPSNLDNTPTHQPATGAAATPLTITRSQILNSPHPNLPRLASGVSQSIPASGRPGTQPPPVQTGQTPPLSPEAQAVLDRWNQEETQVRNKLIQSTISFATFRFFNESILGNKPEDVMAYYNEIINAPNPKEFYYSKLTFLSRLLAQILVPIIEWIIGLIFHYKEQKLTGIANISARAKAYFSNPSVRDRELERALETGSDYFFKLHNILESYAEGEGGTLTFQEYLRQKLNEDLHRLGMSKEGLYTNANTWFVDMINLQTEIPIFGPLVDMILKSTLRPILNRANIAQNIIHHGLGNIRPSSGFSYAVMDFIAKRLRHWTISLQNRNENLSAQQADGAHGAAPQNNSNSLLENPQHQFTRRQQALLKTFFKRLVRYLPYESAQTEEILASLEAEKHMGMVSKWAKKKILEALEKLFVQVIQSLYREYSKEEQQRFLWLESLKLLQAIYTTNLTRSESECQQIRNEAKVRLSEFIDTALEHHFNNEFKMPPAEKEKVKAEQLTRLTRSEIQTSLDKLSDIHQIINNILNSPNVDQIEAILSSLSRELKELFSNLYNRLTNTYDPIDQELKIKMSWREERGFLRGVDKIADQLKRLNKVSIEILRVTKTLRILLNLKNMTSALLPADNAPAEEDSHTLPSIPNNRFHEWITRMPHMINSLVEAENVESQPAPANQSQSPAIPQPPEAARTNRNNENVDRSVIETHLAGVSARVREIDSLNANVRNRRGIQDHLETVSQTITEIEEINSRLTQRPHEEGLLQATRFLTIIKQDLNNCRRTNILSREFQHSISNINNSANHLQGMPLLVANLHRPASQQSSSPLQTIIDQIAPLERLQRLHEAIERSPNRTSEQLRENRLRKEDIHQQKLQLILLIENNIAEIESRIPEIRRNNHADCAEITRRTAAIQTTLNTIQQLNQSRILPSHLPIQEMLGTLSQLTLQGRTHELAEAITNLSRATTDTLDAHRVNAEAERNEIQTRRNLLRQTLTGLLHYLDGKISGDQNRIREENDKLLAATEHIASAKSGIKDPESIRTKLLGMEDLWASFQKNKFVYPEVTKLANQLLELFLNPMHFEELFLRIVLSRLVPEGSVPVQDDDE